MPTSVASILGTQSSGTAAGSRGIQDMSGMDFLKLLITELSNQDPFEPMKNKEILEQLSAIRSLESNMSMTENFKALLSHQELGSAAALIGHVIRGVDTAGRLVEGKVERIILDAAGVRLQVGGSEVYLKNVTQVGLAEAVAGGV